MPKIYKFEIKPQGSTLELPLDAKPLHCKFVNNRLQVWVQGSFESDSANFLPREFVPFATGEQFEVNTFEYIDTTFRHNGECYHLYRRNV